MIKAVVQMLDDFRGKDVNYMTDGETGVYLRLRDFDWHEGGKDLLFLETEHDEGKMFYVDLKKMEDFGFDEKELEFILESGSQVRLWVE